MNNSCCNLSEYRTLSTYDDTDIQPFPYPNGYNGCNRTDINCPLGTKCDPNGSGRCVNIPSPGPPSGFGCNTPGYKCLLGTTCDKQTGNCVSSLEVGNTNVCLDQSTFNNGIYKALQYSTEMEVKSKAFLYYMIFHFVTMIFSLYVAFTRDSKNRVYDIILAVLFPYVYLISVFSNNILSSAERPKSKFSF